MAKSVVSIEKSKRGSRTKPPERHPPKSIILFSDGTGNSSGKLFKTNVWRMYEAVDLGPSPPDVRDQIAYYDNGVGTSAFKPLAILSGIFGIGLKRNVLHLYQYACRNYRPIKGQKPGQEMIDEGDYIYGFGFSRGAFTMRMLIGFIADQGLVPYTSEAQLARDSASAYRRFRLGRPRYWFSPMRPVLWIIRALAEAPRAFPKSRRYNPALNYQPVIKFVGVWDTVAAYGGPIAELTRAIDNWIYRLSMPDHSLHERVQCARHALALDDERDSFHPLLWDEVHERRLIEEKESIPDGRLGDWINEDRLEQVWFCGMHADVGGGYPDESLSYVSLLWMIEEAHDAGIRTLKGITDRYRALANSFGPIHNSRGGLGAYYRYQPRNISAWLHPVDNSTLSYRDPAIRSVEGPKGLLTGVKIHESVIARIASGTDRYAPFALPKEFSVHPPAELAENLPQPVSEVSAANDAQFTERDDSIESAKSTGEAQNNAQRMSEMDRFALVDPRDRLRMEKRTDWARDAMMPVWDLVWVRRIAYFATLGATLLLLAMPLWIGVMPDPPFLADGRTWLGSLIGLVGAFAPQFLEGWIRVYQINAFYTLVLVIIILVLLMASTKLEFGLRDRARLAWHQVLNTSKASDLPERERRSWLEKIRTSRRYQRSLQIVKWHVLPNLFGPALIVLGIWALLGTATQVALPTYERGSRLCALPVGQGDLKVISRDFSVRDPCTPMTASVQKGIVYDVSVYVVDRWSDSDHATTPQGLPATSFLWGLVGSPFKRVINASYLQPVIEVRPVDKANTLMRKIFMYPLKLTRDSGNANLYRGRFRAPHSGDLFLLPNDDVLPFVGSWADGYDLKYFYERSGNPNFPGNYGTACVLIARADAGGDTPVLVVSPICQKAAEQVRALEAAKAGKENRPPSLLQ